jgi:hypothetical protein
MTLYYKGNNIMTLFCIFNKKEVKYTQSHGIEKLLDWVV